MPSESKSSRKLAAILFADIVGYTALMQQGEGKTMSILNRFQEVTADQVLKHHGEIIKTYGDGSLILFDSTVDAVRCAHDMQVAFKEEPIVPLRTGIHVGEVVRKDNDVFGNGVNIASRVESMGVAGAVLLSADAQKKIKNQEAFKTQSLGSFEFKNVEEPIEVFALTNSGFPIPNKSELEGKFKNSDSTETQKSRNQKWFVPVVLALLVAVILWYFLQNSIEEIVLNPKSIAVLPFTDLSPDKDQEYFSIGMMDEILNHLVKIEDLQVSSRTSSMQFANTITPIPTISKQLGVASVLEGSIRKAGDQVRITVQLIDGETDKHLWSESYDRGFEDIFGIQSDVAQTIARTLKAEIYPDVKERIEAVPTENMEAYDLWLRSQNEDFEESERLLHQAIQIDSSFASAYASLANIWLNRGGFAGGRSRAEIIPEVTYYLEKALEKDKNCADAHRQKAQFALWYYWDFETAGKAWETYLRLNPSFINANVIDFYSSAGKFEKAKDWAERVNLMFSKESSGWTRRALPYYLSGDYKTSDEYIAQTLEQFPGWFSKSEAARGLAYSGHYLEAISVLESSFEESRNSRFPRNLGVLTMAYHHNNQPEKASLLLDELLARCDSGPTGSPSFYTAMVYAQMGEIDNAFQWLEKSYQDHEVEMFWLKVEPPFAPLHNDPRWEEMLFKVGFDVPVKG